MHFNLLIHSAIAVYQVPFYGGGFRVFETVITARICCKLQFSNVVTKHSDNNIILIATICVAVNWNCTQLHFAR